MTPAAEAAPADLPFTAVSDLEAALREKKYVADRGLATTLYLTLTMQKPLLLEGEAGVGKTEIAKVLADMLGAPLIRLQCYEGLDASSAIYEWDYPRQMLFLRSLEAAGSLGSDQVRKDLFSEEFLLSRPLLTAIRRSEPTVLLVDEVDKADIEIEGLLLEVLSDFAVTIPELGTIEATRKPFAVLTSNAARELSEALKRRCLYLHLDFPTPELERRILASRVPELDDQLAEQLVRVVGVLRAMALKKVPSVSETIDWGRTLVALGLDTIDDETVLQTLGVVLKHQSDQLRAAAEMRLN